MLNVPADRKLGAPSIHPESIPGDSPTEAGNNPDESLGKLEAVLLLPMLVDPLAEVVGG